MGLYLKSCYQLFFVVLLASSSSCHAESSGNNSGVTDITPTHNSVLKCNLQDLQQCHSCDGLKNSIDLSNPDFGEYYRGAYWNGLYAAYRLNCLDVGKILLEHKANPNLGGMYGSFTLSLVRKWPHKNEEINKQWLALIKNYSIDLDWKNPYMDQSAKELAEEDNYYRVEYPEIWEKLKSINTK